MGAFSEVFSNEQISQLMEEAVKAANSEAPPATGPQLPSFMALEQVMGGPTVGPDAIRTPNWINRQASPDYPDNFALMPTYATPGYSEGRIAASIPFASGSLGFGASGVMEGNKGRFSGADIQYTQGDTSYGLEYRTDPKGRAFLGRFSTAF